MADRTGIEWTDATWNPIVGCSVVSPGCTNCYAMKMAARLQSIAESERAKNIVGIPHYLGLVAPSKGGPVWTGTVRLARPETLAQPLRWRRPRRIFVNSMGDLFHEDVPDAWIDRVFAIMALSPQHTYQVLTKRSARMRAYLSDHDYADRASRLACEMATEMLLDVVLIAHPSFEQLAPADRRVPLYNWPLPNVWLGVSTEDQRRADERVPDLLATPTTIRFVSAEPLLGPLDFMRIASPERQGIFIDALEGAEFSDPNGVGNVRYTREPGALSKLNLVIVGGENGPRPMHPDWARSLRDQCAAAGTAFFLKQWGSWAPGEWAFDLDDHLQFTPDDAAVPVKGLNLSGADARMIWSEEDRTPEGRGFLKVGKRAAGRLLDGVEHNAMPEVRS